MNLNGKITGLLFTLFFTLMISKSWAQITVYNNFGEGHDGWDYNYGLGWTVAGDSVSAQYGVEQAMLFQSTTTGVVSDIWLAVSYVPLSSLPDTVIIRLAEDPSGLPPDTADIMEEWTLTLFGSWSQWNTPIHLTGNGNSMLQEGNTYWLWALGKETTWCMWAMNEDPALTIPHAMRREGENWLSISNETASAFRVDVSTGIGIADPLANNSQNCLLSQNYPNPFPQTTKITYSINSPGKVDLKIYDLLGREIQNLVSEYQDSGTYTVDFDASRLNSGIYLYKLFVGNNLAGIKKMNKQ